MKIEDAEGDWGLKIEGWYTNSQIMRGDGDVED